MKRHLFAWLAVLGLSVVSPRLNAATARVVLIDFGLPAGLGLIQLTEVDGCDITALSFSNTTTRVETDSGQAADPSILAMAGRIEFDCPLGLGGPIRVTPISPNEDPPRLVENRIGAFPLAAVIAAVRSTKGMNRFAAIPEAAATGGGAQGSRFLPPFNFAIGQCSVTEQNKRFECTYSYCSDRLADALRSNFQTAVAGLDRMQSSDTTRIVFKKGQVEVELTTAVPVCQIAVSVQ